MKKLAFYFATLCALLFAPCAHAAHVQFWLTDFISTPATGKVVRITHTGPTISGTNIVPTVQFIFRSDTNGQLTISNMVAAHYDVQIAANIWAVTSFAIDVPDTNILVDASTIISTGEATQAWQTIADGRYVARSDGGATNLSIYGYHLFTTNVAGVVSVLPSAFTTIIVNATTNTTFTLPGSSFVADGRIFRFKNVSTNRVTLDAAGSDLIDGAADFTLTNRYDQVELIKERTNWWKFGNQSAFDTGLFVPRFNGGSSNQTLTNASFSGPVQTFISRGASAEYWWAPTASDTFLAVFDRAQGDPDTMSFRLETLDNSASPTNDTYFHLSQVNSTPSLEMDAKIDNGSTLENLKLYLSKLSASFIEFYTRGEKVFRADESGLYSSSLPPSRLLRSDGSSYITAAPTTNSTTATTGSTMHAVAGRVRLAFAQQTYLLTNNLATTNSVILATLNSDDTTAKSVIALPTTGLITFKCNATTTTNTDIAWLITAP